jgi:hypothetical protein
VRNREGNLLDLWFVLGGVESEELGTVNHR